MPLFEQIGDALVADLFERLGGGLVVERGHDLGALRYESASTIRARSTGLISERRSYETFSCTGAALARYWASRQSMICRPTIRLTTAAWAKPAQQRLRANINANQAIGIIDTRELHVVYAHDPPPSDIDNLVIEHILAQQHLAVAAAERAQIYRRAGELRHTIDRLELGGRYEEQPAAIAHNQAADRRVGVVADAHNHIFKPAEQLVALATHHLIKNSREE